MKPYLEKLKVQIEANPPNFGDSNSALALLYEAYHEVNPMDNSTIKEDFNELYCQMNGMSLREMDNIIYPVCKLCRDHEREGFVEGIKIGILLFSELTEK